MSECVPKSAWVDALGDGYRGKDKLEDYLMGQKWNSTSICLNVSSLRS